MSLNAFFITFANQKRTKRTIGTAIVSFRPSPYLLPMAGNRDYSLGYHFFIESYGCDIIDLS